MPDCDRLCHGDFHPMNVLGEASQPIVIDWPNACRGDPAGDVCRSYLLLRLHTDEVADPYLDAYCGVSRVPRQIILLWLPFVAAARLTEDVPGERIVCWESSAPRDQPGWPARNVRIAAALTVM
jgi:Ser/Thr protein kinase RdoA (MazF antagonist)